MSAKKAMSIAFFTVIDKVTFVYLM